MHKKDIAYLIGLEPKEAVKYLESHGVQVPKTWTTIVPRVKVLAKKAIRKFKLDMTQKTFDHMKREMAQIEKDITSVMDATKDEIAKAIKTGSGERLFKKRMTEVLKETGFLDQKSRLSLIYRTQVSQAYSAGRWKAIEKAAPLMPYLTYHCSMLPTSRDPHKALNGMTYHINDPIWNSIYPPNGFHCKCWVTQHSARDIENRGTHIHQSADTPWASDVPDPGWSKNPAKNPEDVYQIDYERYNNNLLNAHIKQKVSSKAFADFYNGKTDQKWVQIGVMSEPVEKIVKKATGAKTKVVNLSKSTINEHLHREQDIGLKEYAKLPDVINDPDIIIKDLKEKTKGVEVLLFYKADKQRKFEAVVKVTVKKDEMFIKTFHDAKKPRTHRGDVIYEKKN